MSTIYLATKGQYSSYTVVAAFTKREDAELFIERHADSSYWGWNDIETLELDSGVEKMRDGFTHWWVQMDERGEISNKEPSPDNTDTAGDSDFRGNGRAARWFNWYGWAKDEQHAIKCANEHRIALLAKTL